MRNSPRKSNAIPLLPSLVLLSLGIAIGYKLHDEQRLGRGSQSLPAMSIFFSPAGGCTDAIVREISGARKEILVQAYSFTSKDIAAAISRKTREGVHVAAVLDASNRTAHYSAATYLAHAHVLVFIDDAHAIAHNKVMVIDGQTVITGSFNFTRAAEARNAENLLIIHDAKIARTYAENFAKHKAHSSPY